MKHRVAAAFAALMRARVWVVSVFGVFFGVMLVAAPVLVTQSYFARESEPKHICGLVMHVSLERGNVMKLEMLDETEADSHVRLTITIPRNSDSDKVASGGEFSFFFRGDRFVDVREGNICTPEEIPDGQTAMSAHSYFLDDFANIYA